MAEWELLSVIELAEHLKLNPQTLRNWIREGKLEHVQVGRARHVPRHAAVALAGGTGHEIPELLTVTEVAKLLRLNEMTVRNWIDAGTLPHVWLGERRVRIKRSDLDAFIEAGSTLQSITPVEEAR